MAYSGTGTAGKILTATGITSQSSFKLIGTDSGLTNHGVLLSQNLNPFVSVNPGAAGTVLMSNGVNADPSFQSGGLIFANTITGNDGIPIAPVSGNWTFITSNATVKFLGTAGTETVNFGLTNLILGTSGASITSATLNVGLGASCMTNLTSGGGNVGIGNSCLSSLTTGSTNVAVGFNSANALLSGVFNVLLGAGAGQSLTTQSACTAIGNGALVSCTGGAGPNTCVGKSSLGTLLTGINNVAVGYFAGNSFGGSESSNIALGNTGTAGDNNTIRIGTQGSGAGQQNLCFIAGIVGVTASNPVLTTINSSTGQLGVQALTQNAVMIGGASNAVAFTTVGSTGQVLQGNTAAAPTYSTAAYPSTATSTGTILRADGTNWVATTSTYPATTTINQVLYSSSNNVIGGITAANNGTMISGTTGIPSWLANGTTGQVLTATTGSPPSWAPPATSGTVTSVSGTANQVAVANGTTTPVISLIGPYTPATYTAHGVLIGEGTSSIVATTAGSAGQHLQSGGASADPNWTTATFPATATGSGTILRADGTNWVATTATYPTTTTSQQILYSTAANVIGQLTTANSAIAATNSSGTLAMRALSVVIQVFTGNGTYTPTSGMLYCIVRCIGGGGGGGGGATSGVGQSSTGGGGGAGEYSEGVFSAATVGASQAVTIGAAGAANSGATGGNGGTSSLGALITSGGGSGGVTSAAGAGVGGLGGAGGTGGSGGSFRSKGGGGFFGWALAGTFNTSGQGANSQYGSGGIGTFGGGTGGNAAAGYGSGGGGFVTSNSAAAAGGAGTAGLIVVTEYVIA